MIYRAAASTLQLLSLPDVDSGGTYLEPYLTLIGGQPRLLGQSLDIQVSKACL